MLNSVSIGKIDDIHYQPLDYHYKIYNMTRREALALFVKAHQVKGGGFVYTLISATPGLDGTWRALEILDYLGMLDIIDRKAAIDFIMSHWNGSTFTWAPPELSPTVSVFSLAAAVASLDILGALDLIDREALLNWLMRMYDPETGLFYAYWQEGEGRVNLIDILGDYGAIVVLDRLNALDLIDREKFIRSFYKYYFDKERGMFTDLFVTSATNWYGVATMVMVGGLNESVANRIAHSIVGEIDPFTGLSTYNGHLGSTGDIVHALYLMGMLEYLYDPNLTLNSILSRQSHVDGGFLNTYSSDVSADLLVTVKVIRAIFALNGSERLDEEFYIEEIPEYQGDWDGSYDDGEDGTGDSGSSTSPIFPPPINDVPQSDSDDELIEMLELSAITALVTVATMVVVRAIIVFFSKISRMISNKSRGRKKRIYYYRKRRYRK